MQRYHIQTPLWGIIKSVPLLVVVAGMTGCQSKPGSTPGPGLSLGIASVPNLRDL